MNREQENRILANQKLIMETLIVLLSESNGGRGAMQQLLRLRIADIEQFTEQQQP